MRGPRLAAALLGLGAVRALPAKAAAAAAAVQERDAQTFGPPGSTLTPGDPGRELRPPCSLGTDRLCYPPSDPPRRGLRPGRRDTTASSGAPPLPPDANPYRRDVLASLQVRLDRLRGRADRAELMRTIRHSMDELAGLAWLTSDAGVKISTLRPTGPTRQKRDVLQEEDVSESATKTRKKKSKRQVLILPSSGGRQSCPSVDVASRELPRLEDLLRRARVRGGVEDLALQAFGEFLRSCGMRLEQDDEGYLYISTAKSPTSSPSEADEADEADEGGPEEEGEGEYYDEDWERVYPRAVEDEGEATKPEPEPEPQADSFDPAGLQAALDALTSALGDASPAYPTFLVLQRLKAALAGHPATTAETLAALRARQTLGSGSGGIIAIGAGACQLADVLALKAALAALATAYGPPSSAPPTIFLVEQVIVSALQICQQEVPGWTTLTPGNPIPGGPMVPERPAPGAPAVPERPVASGGPVPERPVPGVGGTPERPIRGGGAVPERPVPGGPDTPERPVRGIPEPPSD